MIGISRLYVITGMSMAALLVSMVLDALIPVFSNVWIDAIAHPFVAISGIILVSVLLYEKNATSATYAYFIAAAVTLLTATLNEALISMVETGTIPITLSVLASLSVKNRIGWPILAITSIAAILNASVLASSVLLALIIGGGIALLLERWSDA